jgi:hypothetical protein
VQAKQTQRVRKNFLVKKELSFDCKELIFGKKELIFDRKEFNSYLRDDMRYSSRECSTITSKVTCSNIKASLVRKYI